MFVFTCKRDLDRHASPLQTAPKNMGCLWMFHVLDWIFSGDVTPPKINDWKIYFPIGNISLFRVDISIFWGVNITNPQGKQCCASPFFSQQQIDQSFITIILKHLGPAIRTMGTVHPPPKRRTANGVPENTWAPLRKKEIPNLEKKTSIFEGGFVTVSFAGSCVTS